MAILSDSWKVDALALVIGAITVAFFFAKRAYSYWERNGFVTLPGYSHFVGHFSKTFSGKFSLGDWALDLYNSTKEPFIGIYGIFRPMLLVRDPELIRSILIKDFPNFTDRGIHVNEEYDPLSGNLFGLSGQRWKNMRGKLSPTFTSGKLKAMFSTLNDCGLKLQNHLEKLASSGEKLDVREISASHSTNVIASVAFGIDIDTIKNPDNEFRVCGRKIFEPSFWNITRGLISIVQPKLLDLLKLKAVDQSVEDFIKSVVTENLEYREKNNVTRKDFFQLMIQLRNSGTVQLDDQWETVMRANDNQKSLTINEMAAQAFLFFAAGFETSSTTLSFCLFELTKNPEIQEQVHNEIDRVLEEHDGKITYESVTEMKFLENCLDETLRKYPPLPFLNRTCLNDYTIPGSNGKVLEKGVEVFIPVLGLHRDPNYWQDPVKFEPDRFSDDKNISQRPYLPFGDGPRNCIGMRLGKMQTKVGLVMMLQKFRFELEGRLRNKELEFDPKSFLLSPLGGISVSVFRR